MIIFGRQGCFPNLLQEPFWRGLFSWPKIHWNYLKLNMSNDAKRKTPKYIYTQCHQACQYRGRREEEAKTHWNCGCWSRWQENYASRAVSVGVTGLISLFDCSLKSTFVPFKRKLLGDTEPAILFWDNAAPHTLDVNMAVYKDITILMLPPNLTARHQPMDAGIIATL